MSDQSKISGLTNDLHAPLSAHEALVESDRCYFCYDAPCVTACPTGIDIPLFIRQIKTANPKGAAKTIFDENIFGGMCARVCPTETLCEQKCVRQEGEEKPVLIGQLQRYATDTLMATGKQPYTRKAHSGRRVAVVGAGPAGLACAHRLSLHGHEVTVFEAKAKSGGLNEFGIASYKTVDNFAQKEIDYILSIGGIDVQHGKMLGKDITLENLKNDFDAIFIGVGLAGVNQLGIEGENLSGVDNAVEFIATLRQSEQPASLAVGQQVVVIGGGMTAIDAAIQSKMLGADQVSVVYRRDQSNMNASVYEQELAQKNGVMLRTNLQPVRLSGSNGKVTTATFEHTESAGGSVTATGSTIDIACDQVLVAIGQTFNPDALPTSLSDTLLQSSKRFQVDEAGRTPDPKIWAGGDCVTGGEDLTVTAVQHGKLAAESIHRSLESAHG